MAKIFSKAGVFDRPRAKLREIQEKKERNTAKAQGKAVEKPLGSATSGGTILGSADKLGG